MGDYAWNTLKSFFSAIEAKKIIQNSDLFSPRYFRKNFVKILFSKKTHKANIWLAFVFAKTFNNLEKINNLKS